MRDRPSWILDVSSIFIVIALLAAVYLLPPDTSLRQLQESGVLRVCMPTNYPPLVMADSTAPGVDVELMRLVAERLGVRLVIAANDAIARDFNPRSWQINRAQCQMVAGGVVASNTTKAFLDVTPPYLDTGWAAIWPSAEPQLSGATVGFYAGLSGLDRIALSSYLQRSGATTRLAGNAGSLTNGLRSGTYQLGVTEALLARRIAGENDWNVAWLPESLGRYPVALGLWKGDLTLKRAVTAILAELTAEGVMDDLLRRYDIAPIDATFTVPG